VLDSINARLGALLARLRVPDRGEDLPALTTDWLDDLVALRLDDIRQERARSRRPGPRSLRG